MLRPVSDLIEFDQFRLEAARGWLKCGDEIIPLPPKVVSLLRLLLQNAGQVVNQDQILATVWPDTVVEESNLTQYVHLLRKIFKQHGGQENLIETLPRVGYRFNGVVRELAEEQGQELFQELPASLAERTALLPAGSPASSSSALTVPPPGLTRWRKPTVAAGSLLMLALLTVAGVVTVRTRNSIPVAASIAVLPFSALGVESLAPSLRLGGFSQLEVRPTAAVRGYTEKEFDLLQAGRDLGVEALVTGNVQRENGRLRVTIQVLRIADKRTLWAGQFDESFTQFFALQDRIASQTAVALRLTQAVADPLPTRHVHTPNLEAYQLYLKGRYFWNRRTPE